MADCREQFQDFMTRVKAKRTEAHAAQNGKSKNKETGIESVVVQRVNS